MRRRAVGTVLAALATAALVAAPARGQAIAAPLPSLAPVGGFAFAQLEATGAVAVEWESDPATCASVGRCGMRGTTAWRPAPEGSLLLIEQGGAREAIAFLDGSGRDADQAVTTRVRSGSRLCADAGAGGPAVRLPVAGGRVELGVAGLGGLGSTRCAGPLDADLAAALPPVRVPYGRLARGRIEVPLEGRGEFAAAGLRGTATSSLRLKIDRAQRSGPIEAGGAPRVRYASSRFRVAAVRGDVPVELAGGALGSWPCSALDACGLAGIQRLVPVLDEGSVELLAYARARRSRRVTRAAVGRAPGGLRRGVLAIGAGHFTGPGRIEASVGRPGEEPCTDTSALDGLALYLEPHGRSVTATLDATAGPPRTRCAGPLLRHRAGFAGVEVPLRAFGRRRVELRFSAPRRFRDDGWSAIARPALTVVLHRTAFVEGFVGG